MNTNTKVFGNKRMTARAALRSAIGIDCNELSASFFRFTRECIEELSPTGISNRFSKVMIAEHPIDIKLLNGDNAKGINQFSGFLVNKVVSPVSDAFVDTADNLFRLASFRCPLIQLRQLSLTLSQSLLISSEKAGVGNLLSNREGSESLQSHVNAHRRIGWWQWLRFVFRGEAGVPLIILPSDGAGADFAEGLAVHSNFHITHLGQVETAIDMKSKLGIGEAVIPIIPLEAGIARLLPSLHSPEKSTEGFVKSVSHILKNLGVDIAETRALYFKLGDALALLEIGKRFLLFLPSILTLLKKLVIKPAAFIKLGLQKIGLVLGGIKSVFKSFLHNKYYILKEGGCQSDSSPALKCGAFSAWS